MKYFGIVFFSLVMGYLAYILMAGAPLDRINRVCAPAAWTRTAMATTGSIVSARAEQGARRAGDEMHQACRYFVFRQFYADLYAEMKRRSEAAAAQSTARAASGKGR